MEEKFEKRVHQQQDFLPSASQISNILYEFYFLETYCNELLG